MSKIIEINILTTDKTWWRLTLNGISATKDEIIANTILAQKSVSAGRIWGDSVECIDNPVYINTANIIAIEVIREIEEENPPEDGDIPCDTCDTCKYYHTAKLDWPCCECLYSKVCKYEKAEN